MIIRQRKFCLNLQTNMHIYFAIYGETNEGLGNKFLKRNEPFVSKGLKVKFLKTEVMDTGGITKDGLFRNSLHMWCLWLENYGYFSFVCTMW